MTIHYILYNPSFLPPSIVASFAPDLEQTMLMYPCQKFDPMQRMTQKTPRPANTRAGFSSNRTSESFLQGLGDKLRSQSAPAFIVAEIKLIKWAEFSYFADWKKSKVLQGSKIHICYKSNNSSSTKYRQA